MTKWDLPKGWKIGNFADLPGSNGLITDGDWILNDDLKTGDEVRLIQLADIGEGEFLDKSNKHISKKRALELKCTFLESGDILISRLSDPLLKSCILPESVNDCITAVDVSILRPDISKYDIKYVNHYLNSNVCKEQARKYSVGTTRKRISRKNIEKIKIPIPPLETQQKIVAILDKAEKIKRLRAEANAQTQKLIQSVFLDMFGDPLTNSKRLPIEKISSISHINPKFGNKFDLSFEVSFIPMSQVEENTGIVHLEFTRKFGEVMKGYTPCQDGDVLFAKITPCMENGKVAIAQGLKNGIGFASTEFHVIRPKDESMKYYLWSILINERIRNLAKERMTGSAGQQRVPSTFIKDLSIPIPKKPDILAFNSQIKKINEIKTQLPSIDDNVGLIFDSFMKTAFKGELVA